MTGRPSLYTAEVADKILELLAEGQTLKEICRNDEELPAESTVRLWAVQDREGFKQKYLDAREIGYHAMADEVLDIADDGRNDWMERQNDSGGSTVVADHEHISRSRLRFDARRWLLSKALPKVYGDRLDLNAKHDVADGVAELLRAIDGKTKGLPNKETAE